MFCVTVSTLQSPEREGGERERGRERERAGEREREREGEREGGEREREREFKLKKTKQLETTALSVFKSVQFRCGCGSTMTFLPK